MSSRPPPKKPSGGRPNVRKLLSKDSFSSLASFTKHAREPSQPDDAHHDSRRVQQSTLPPLKEVQSSREAKAPYVEEELVSSPLPSKVDHDPFDEYAAAPNVKAVKHEVSGPTLTSARSSIMASARQSTTSLDLDPSRTSTSSPPPLVSPSKVRWEQLRHYVLPVPSPNPSFTSFSQLNLPTPVPATPRPSRLAARFGFRQVVNEAREAADDTTRRFADDIQKACWAVRFGDTKPPKPEREASQPSTLGSTLHLPFMSSASLPLSGNASSNNLSAPSTFRNGLRGVTSMANLTSQAGSRMNALANLQATVNRYASFCMQDKPTYGILPHEKEILSVLLIAFLSQNSGQDIDDERHLSLELFEIVIRRWKALHSESNIERCLWCCKAATTPALNLRARILYLLDSILTSEDIVLSSPLALQTILPSLTLLVSHCQNSDPSQSVSLIGNTSDLSFVHELIGKILAGSCGHLDLDDLEQRYQALALKTDTEDDLRRGLCVEALTRCLEFGMPDQKRIMLPIIEKYWPSPDLSKASTPLRSKIHLSKISAFLRPVLTMLQDSLRTTGASNLSASDFKIVTRLLITRVLPEIGCLTSSDDFLHDVQSLTVKFALTLLGSEAVEEDDDDDTFADPKHSEVREIVLDWLHGKSTPLREALQKELKGFASGAEWVIVIPLAYRLVSILPESSRKTVVGLIIPQFQERMVDDPPPSPCEPLSRLLTSFAAIHPQVFYKPLFVCAASTKEDTVAHQLAILVVLAHYMPNFWTTDPEMVSVALMSDPGSGAGLGKCKAKDGQSLAWGKARLGQTAVLLELIERLRSIREDHSKRQDAGMASSVSMAKTVKFLTTLEARLAILVDAKEQNVLLPLSQRILFATLFLEIRLITRTLKSTAWLPRILAWAMHYSEDSESSATMLPPITENLQDEVDEIWERLEVVYSLAKISMRPASQRRNTSMMSPKADSSFPNGASDSQENLIDARFSLLKLLPKDPLCSLLEVLVTLSGALKHDDYVRLGPLVWDKCLSLSETKAVINACFICMQCAEKAQDKFLSLLLARLQSPSFAVRRTTVERLSVISSWRFQLLSVTYITDRTYRRPFKLARPPLSFVPTDVGDSKYIPDDDLEEVTGGKGHALPLDIRRRLNEIGWDDEEKPIDQQLEWRRTPMSLLGSSQLDQISTSDAANDDGRLSDQSPSPVASPGNTPSRSSGSEEGLLRRSSSSHGHHVGKRRPVFVQPLVAVFLPLAKLAMDSDFSVASIARDLLMDYMRDDPAVLCRPVIDILSGNVESVDNAVATLRTFLHLSKVLPPRLTHHVFNHLAGFLKFLAKDPSVPDSLHDLAHIIPILARFASQVSDMSVRAIRRGKIEVFLFPSGSLYFPESVPSGPMFPKRPDLVVNPFDSCPKTVVNMTMIRMSQNLLFVDMLKRSPQDVHIIRKNWTPLVLPDVIDVVDSTDIAPRRSTRILVPERSKTSFRLSLSFSRTHLLFVAQMFRSLTRHLNDRDELATLLDGVNRILLRHGDDIGIVSHALIVYMIASTRFRRLMSSGTGFTLFLPALIKVYCEAEGDSGVREAIEYAVHRFFAVHEEVFVYQGLQVVSNLVSQPSTDGAWISSRVYHLLSTLKSPASSSHDAAGIRNANKAQEEGTALAITADERPQMFLASLRKDSKTGAEKLQSSLSVEIFDSKRFHPDNIIRMLLTVIAHDPTVRRAQYFVRLFRYLVPDLYEASSSARNVLKEAVEALGAIIASKMNKAKGAETGYPKATSGDETEETLKANAHTSNKLFGNPSSPCDLQVMRSDYLLIFASYVGRGGAHRDIGLQRALDVVKVILKESSTSPDSVDSVRLFLEQIGESFDRRQDVKYAIILLKEFAPIIRAHGSILDLSGLFKSLVTLCSAPNFANDTKFSNVVVTQICSAALEICEMAAHENILSTLKFVPTLVTLLARSVCLLGSDVIAELEKRDPSPDFLCGIILPFISQLYTTAELATETQWTDSWRQDALARAWARLLSFAVSAFQTQQSTKSNSSRGSVRRSPSFTGIASDPSVEIDEDTYRGTLKKARRRPSGQSSVIVSIRLAMAFVMLKAVVLRGEEDISTVFPGAWVRVGALLRHMLRDGNAMFALRTHLASVPPSPAISPMSSMTFAELIDKPTEKKHRRSSSSTSDVRLSAPSHSSRPTSPSQFPSRRNSSQQFPCPRFVDYLAWSLLEFLCLRRSPLAIQLRTYMHERVVPLNEALQGDEPTIGNSSFSGSARARRSLRPVSTMYSKPRFGSGSAATTPEASPRLGPSDPNISFAGNLSSIYGTSGLAGADYSTSSPMRLKGRSPITHLGVSAPPANSFLSPSFVPASTSAEAHLSQPQSAAALAQNDMVVDARQALAMTTLRSPGLVQRTYERVRVVQRCLGYSTFLPIPESLTRSVDVASSNSEMFDFSAGGMGNVSASASPRASIIFNTDREPEVRVWTRGKAAMHLMAEARDLLRAWQVESAIIASASDAGHGDGSLSAAASAEADLNQVNATFTSAVEVLP